MSMTYGSLFAGIGGFCLGMERAGMRCAWRVEIEPNCCRVLSRHFPEDHLHKDVRDFHAADGLVRPDVITFGSPCQDVSVAGRRAGLAGSRSGLFFDAVRIIGEFKPQVIVMENVPGLLSSNRGRDMGAVVGALGDLGFGLAWRVLDAQWFGVAQRRKRLFVVGCAGADVGRAGKILFERESMPGNPEPKREAWQAAAGAAQGCSGGRCPRGRGVVSCDDVADPICTREGKTWTCEGKNNFRLRNVVAFTKSRRARSDADHETWVEGDVAPTQNQFDASSTRATTVVVPTASWWDGSDVSETLSAVLAKGQTMPDKHRSPAVLQSIPAWVRCHGCENFLCTIHGQHVADCPCPPIEEWGIDPYGSGGPGPRAVGWLPATVGALNDGAHRGGGMNGQDAYTGRVFPAPGGTGRLAVRRILPLEAERLQGFPDAWTAEGCDGRPLSDSARYKALGNAVAVPVAEWIARRIVASGTQERTQDRT
jgi:DNA (cytosine-5)-methyltransferase 1